MTPTLFGRWQSRFFLLGTIGSLTTLLFAVLFRSLIPFILLAVVMLLGLGWDVVYDRLQKRRWDRDWPPTLQLAAGVAEGMLLAGLLYGARLLPAPTPTQFVLHYTAVWLTTFLASQSLMRLLFPRWRYHGGQWI